MIDMGLNKRNIEMEGNSAINLLNLLNEVLKQDESGADGLPTGIIIDLPDGRTKPVVYAWYDRQRDMVRLCFVGDDEEE